MSVGAVNKSTGDRIPTAGMPAIDAALSGSSTNPVQNRVVKAALDGKVDAESGKGLSENDYTNTDKAKVAASLNVFTGTQAEWAQLSTAEKKAYQRADFTDDYDNTAIGDLTALHTSAKSSIVNAINEVADGKQNATDNNLQTTDKTIVGGINEVKSGLNGFNEKTFFGGFYGKYYRTTESSIDGIVDNVISATSDDTGYFSAENKASIVGFGNRQFVFGWTNAEKTFAWIIVCAFGGVSIGTRANASTFTFTSLTS